MPGIARDHKHGNEAIPASLTADVLTFTDQAANPDAAGELQRNGSSLLFFGGSLAVPLGSVFREAIDTTERTTATGTAVSLSTLTTSIPVTDGFIALAKLRKTTGAAAFSSVGLMLNTAAVLLPVAWSSSDDLAQTGTAFWFVWSQRTGYLTTSGIQMTVGSTVSTAILTSLNTASMPNATITSVILRANSGNAAITMACQDFAVYRLVGT